METALRFKQPPNVQIENWEDDAFFQDTTETTCFERVLATKGTHWYFGDPEIFQAFRTQVSICSGVRLLLS